METFSFFTSGVQSKKPSQSANIEDFHRQLGNSAGWKFQIETWRKLPNEQKGIEKPRLPAISPSVLIPENIRRAGLKDGNFEHTHLIQADFDAADDFNALSEHLKSDIHVRLCFRSPSAKVKAFIRVAPVQSITDHSSAFQAVTDYCIQQGYGEIDQIVAPVNSLCFISHDPTAILKDAEPLPWTLKPSEPTPASTTIEYQGEFVGLADWLAKNNVKVTGERKREGDSDALIIECPWADEHTLHTQFGTAVFEKDGKWAFHCFHDHCSDHGWADFRSKVAPIRKKHVLIPADISAPSGKWQDHQPSLDNAFKSPHQITLIRSDTGTGKDYAKVSYIIDTPPDSGKFVEMVPRVLLGQEKITSLLERATTDREIYLWKGVATGWNRHKYLPWHERKEALGDPDGIMCIQAGKYSALWRKGINPQRQLCPSCPSLSICNQVGYRSQTRKAEESDYLISAQDGLLFDPGLKGFAKRIIGKAKRQKTAIVDEVRAHELFSECELPKNALQFIGNTWSGTPAGQFAIDMINALEHSQTPSLDFVKKRVLNLSEMERRQIIQAFSKVRVHGQALNRESDKMWIDDVLKASGKFYPKFNPGGVAISIAVSKKAAEELNDEGIHTIFTPHAVDKILLLDYHQAIAFKFYEIPDRDDDKCLNQIDTQFPRLYSEFWTPLHQLESLFKQYPRIQDTPISYRGGVLTFYLPPVPHPEIDKFVMMSATAETSIIRDKIFADKNVKVIDPGYTQWAEGNAVYQVKSGKYPRKSVLSADGELVGFGRKALDALIAEASERDDESFTLITYKSVEDNYADELPANVQVAHYGAIEGENERFQDTDSFWIMFDPRLPPYEVIRRAQMFFGKDEKPLCYEYDEDSAIYTDPRLKLISDRASEGELIQAIGRARLVRRTGVEVVIMCGRDIPGISARRETVLFDLSDLATAGSIANLSNTVSATREQEADSLPIASKMIRDGHTHQEVQDQLGLSRREIDAIREELGMPSGAEKKAAAVNVREQAREMREKGFSIRKIATQLNVSTATIKRYLKGK